MEAGTQGWGAAFQNRTKNIPSPWENESPSSASLALGGTPRVYASPSPHSNSNGISDFGYGSYLDSDSASSSPLEALYRRTASLGNLYSPGQSPSPHHGHGSPLGFNADGTARRQSLSGPLPSPSDDDSSMAYTRRPSLSGPLPNSANNPYHSPSDEMLPPVRTPPPWSEFHMMETTTTNPYLNPQMFQSPSSLPRPPPGGSSASVLKPANGFKLNGGNTEAPARLLYDYKAASDPFAALSPLNSPAGSGPGSPTIPPRLPSHWTQGQSSPAAVAESPTANGLSQRTHSTPILGAGRSSHSDGGTASNNNNNGDLDKIGSPHLIRSRSAHTSGTLLTGNGNGNGGGVLPFNPKGSGLNRSASFSGTEKGSVAQKFSKGRGGMGEGVVDSLISQLVFAQEKPTVLADMIFSPSKGSSSRSSKGLFAYARDLVERILHAQVHAMAPALKEMALRLGEVEKETWEATSQKNGNEGPAARFPNEGYRLLRLQNQFVEAGLETFDMLCRVRKQFPSLLTGDDGSASTGLLRIALFGGGPGCEALGLRLFFMRLLPALQMQVDIFNRRERWRDIVESISLKGIGYMTVDLFDCVYHPTGLRSYRLLVFLDSLGDGVKRRMNKGQKFNWEEFWTNLYRNTHAAVVVVIHEKDCPWDEMKPRKGSYWWCSALAEQDQVHVARKM